MEELIALVKELLKRVEVIERELNDLKVKESGRLGA